MQICHLSDEPQDDPYEVEYLLWRTLRDEPPTERQIRGLDDDYYRQPGVNELTDI